MGLKNWLFGNKCKKCNDSRTKNKSGICDECELKLEAEKEANILCPICNIEMKKKILEKRIIIDKCPKCTGIFLGREKIESLQKIAESEATSSNHTGLVLTMTGAAMGSEMSHH